MKKITLLVTIAAIAFNANAQDRGSVSIGNSVHSSTVPMKIITMPPNANRGVGDTLMYMPLPTTLVNGTDAAAFTIVTEDLDGLSPNNAGYAMDFGNYYSTDSSLGLNGSPVQSNFYHPWESPAPLGLDTAFFWSATSWFAPAGQANNWLEFGPITIPVGGAKIMWYDRFNRWKDGYQLMVSNVVSSPLTMADFTDAPIFVALDTNYSASNPPEWWARDTTWQLRSVTLPAIYNGQVVAFAFNHNAIDEDVLRLDEITIEQLGSVSIAENSFVNGVKLNQNSPNPFNNLSVIKYELENNAKVVLSVYDVTGKKVATQNAGEQNAGKHSINFNASNLTAGVYYYSLTVGQNATSTMKMVVIK